MKNIKFILTLFFILNFYTKTEDILEDKYFFQLYPSQNNELPNIFYAYTPYNKLMTINSTAAENINIQDTNVNEYVIKDLSSVILYKNSLLIKTCFGPDKIVEIIDEDNFSFPHINTYTENGFTRSLNNINYCYSSVIYDPSNSANLVIITYWTEINIKNNKENYDHKCILFYPNRKMYSEEIILKKSSNLIEKFINDNYYARSCITFKGVDIFCNIHFNSDSKPYGFNIDTSKIFTNEASIQLIFIYNGDDKITYQKPINIDTTYHSLNGYYLHNFLTEYHSKDLNKTILVSSIFIKSLKSSFISFNNKIEKYYGINIEDKYISQYLFNHLLPSNDDLIVIYIMKLNNVNNLLMSRFNLSESITFHTLKEYSMSNYIKDNICSNPKYIQSLFINSPINYSVNDRNIINDSGNNNYYKYQKDIVSLIACSNDNNNVFYQTSKISMPQCLNALDELNENDKHIIKFKDDQNNVNLDIYNDPNLASLRNVAIEFYKASFTDIPIIIRITKNNGEHQTLDLTKTNIINNPTHIQFFRTIQFTSKKALSINYRIKVSNSGDPTLCHLSSDLCKFEFIVKNDDEVEDEGNCNIKYCIFCGSDNKCKKCDNIEGIILDNLYNKCICNENNGFRLEPVNYYNRFDICICKENYSFYKNLNNCLPNEILSNGPYYINRTDDISLIPIYEDCPDNCLSCKINNDNVCCLECKDNNNCELCKNNDVCLSDKKIWFEIGEYKFYYGKINDCIYIFYDNSLFFYSNKSDCNFDHYNGNYISTCLNNPELIDQNNYNLFLENAYEYNPEDKNITIIKEIDKYVFHLVDNQKNDNYSDVKLNEFCEKKIKETYSIDNKTNLLIFKVDIKRNDTISTQVEYQFYNPNPKLINEILDLSLCLPDNETITENGSSLQQVNDIYLSVPVIWSDIHLQNIDELWNNHSIFLFNASDPFYNDVCYRYTTPKKTDIYLQSRREKYYINEPLCEEDCLVDSYNNITNKITCKCPIRLHPNETAIYNRVDLDKIFNGKYLAPNFQVLKCFGLFYQNIDIFQFSFTFLLLLIFAISYPLFRLFKRKRFNKPFKELSDMIDYYQNKFFFENESNDEENQQLVGSEENVIPFDENNQNNNGQNNNENYNNFSRSINVNNSRNCLISNNNSNTKSNNSIISSSKSNQSKVNTKEENVAGNNNIINVKNKKTKEHTKDEEKKRQDKKKEEIKNKNKYEEESYIFNSKNSKNKEKSSINTQSNIFINNNKNQYNIDDDEKNDISQININFFNAELKQSKDMEYDLEKLKSNAELKEKIIDEVKKYKEKVGKKEEEEEEEEEDIKDENNSNVNEEDEQYEKEIINNTQNSEEESQEKEKEIKKEIKKGHFPANPPKKNVGMTTNRTLKKNTKKDKEDELDFTFIKLFRFENEYDIYINNTNNIDMNNERKKKKIYNADYLLDMYPLIKLEKDHRKFCKQFFSLIKNNSTIIFGLPCNDVNDYFIKISVIILSLSFYIFLNIIFMYDSPSLHLYLGKDSQDDFQARHFIINFLIINIIFLFFVTILKRIISIREFISDIYYKYKSIISILSNNEKKTDRERARGVLKLHRIQTELSKFKNNNDFKAFLLAWIGSFFLFFNWCLVTCFVGIYINSNNCLVFNTFISICFRSFWLFFISLISTILRKYSKEIDEKENAKDETNNQRENNDNNYNNNDNNIMNNNIMNNNDNNDINNIMNNNNNIMNNNDNNDINNIMNNNNNNDNIIMNNNNNNDNNIMNNNNNNNNNNYFIIIRENINEDLYCLSQYLNPAYYIHLKNMEIINNIDKFDIIKRKND